MRRLARWVAVVAVLSSPAVPAAASSSVSAASTEATFEAAIIDGQPASINPAVARLLLFGRLGSSSLCTGVVVGANHVVTAAHCVDFTDSTGRAVDVLSSASISVSGSSIGDPDTVVVRASGFEVHPSVDLAILETATAIPVEPAAVWTPDRRPADLGTARIEATVAGWGVIDQQTGTTAEVLTEAVTTIETSRACRLQWGRSFAAAEHLCTVGATPCEGDSGGPLMVDLGDGRPSLGGLTSFGSQTCGAFATVYTRLDPYVDWIGRYVPDLRAPPSGVPTAPGAVRSDGYWVVDRSGVIYEFGAPGLPSAAPDAVAIESTITGRGAWVLAADGTVTAVGDAIHLGSLRGWLIGDEDAVTLASTPSGAGYWIVTDRGRVVGFGDAPAVGDLLDLALNQELIDAAATPSGRGVFLVAQDGGVFALGDAVFRGSMGGQRLNAPVVGLAPTPTNLGYWLVASDGGIFSFGDAEFLGSMGSIPLQAPAVGMVSFGAGYLIVAADGGLFNFSDLEFEGSLGADPPPSPVVAVAPRSVPLG